MAEERSVRRPTAGRLLALTPLTLGVAMKKLLDTLITQAIKQSTGYDAGRMVRKIGGSNLLLTGGALLAGGLAVDHMRQKGGLGGLLGSAPPAPAMSPPSPPPQSGIPSWLPPLPPQAVAPPPPAQTSVPAPPASTPGPAAAASVATLAGPAAAATDGEVPEGLAHALVRTMIAAALADGRMTAEERAAIREEIGRADLSPHQVRELQQDMVLPPGPEEIAALVADAAGGEVLFRFAVAALSADGQRTAAEQAWLDQLAAALALDAARRQDLESEVAAAATLP
jgi:tellurite resistance protein